MLQRLRHLLVALAAGAAVTTGAVAVAGPASAEASTGCADPSVAGAVQRDPAYAYNPWSSTVRLQITATSTAAGNCVSPFTITRYRYQVVLESTATDTVTISSGTQSYASSTGTTTAPFSTGSFTAPKGSGEMRLTIKTYANYGYGWGHVADQDRTYQIDVPGSYDTAPMAHAAETCPGEVVVKPYGFGKWGGCEV